MTFRFRIQGMRVQLAAACMMRIIGQWKKREKALLERCSSLRYLHERLMSPPKLGCTLLQGKPDVCTVLTEALRRAPQPYFKRKWRFWQNMISRMCARS